MAEMLIDGAKLDACNTAEADAIRAKTGGSSPIPYDYANNKGFADSIAAIPSGGTTITDGIVVKARDANGWITEVDKYGDCGRYEFGIASVGFRNFPYGHLESVVLHDCDELGEGTFYNKFITQITGMGNITRCGASCFLSSALPSIHLPKVLYVGSTCFRALTSTTEVLLPVLESHGEYIFQSSTILQNVQIGSIGHPAPTTNKQPFYGCTQQGLTITAFQTGANVDTIVANYRRNATNATIIVKASENTTYNGTSYAAGDTILTSEVT